MNMGLRLFLGRPRGASREARAAEEVRLYGWGKDGDLCGGRRPLPLVWRSTALSLYNNLNHGPLVLGPHLECLVWRSNALSLYNNLNQDPRSYALKQELCKYRSERPSEGLLPWAGSSRSYLYTTPMQIP